LAADIGMLDVKAGIRFLFGYYCFGKIQTSDMTIGVKGVTRSLPCKLFLKQQIGIACGRSAEFAVLLTVTEEWWKVAIFTLIPPLI
jgi:hypothetical protein